MGYRGKLAEQEEARRLRAQSWTLADIAAWLGVSKSSVSLWVKDVQFVPSPRRTGAQRRPHPFHERKLAEIERLNAEGVARIGLLSDHAFLAAGAALYAGEGGKTDAQVSFANSDPRMIAFFCAWFRRFFEVDESRLRVRLYLHEGLDADAAVAFWSRVTKIPLTQFGKVYRAVADPSIRRSKHPMGCPSIRYACAPTHREIMGMVNALLTSPSSDPG
jgi:hypothetical protein